MAKPAGPTKPAKPTREEKKAERAQRRSSRRETWQNLRQAFTLTRQNDKRLIPLLVGSGVVAAAVLWLVLFLILGSPYLPIVVAVLGGLLAALFVFTRRARKSMFGQADGQPGAAGWLLQEQLRGDWRTTAGVAGTAQLDAVHRVLGRPGIILVAEGTSPARVRSLLAQEKKRVARVAGDTPIYDIVVGNGEDDIPLSKLNRYLIKLPRNLSKEQVSALDRRLQALGGARPPIPQGPMPANAKMRNVQRSVRRRS